MSVITINHQLLLLTIANASAYLFLWRLSTLLMRLLYDMTSYHDTHPLPNIQLFAFLD